MTAAWLTYTSMFHQVYSESSLNTAALPIMKLLELPTEVLRLIIQETIPEGFESFTLTCRRVYTMCECKIPKHNQLRRVYRNFRYKRLRSAANDPDFQDRHDIWSSLALLHAIGQEPLIARYIVTADLKGGLAFDEYADDTEEAEAIYQRTIADLKSTGSLHWLLAQSPYLREEGEDVKAWFDAILKDGEDIQHADTFLLTLLPNVEKLSLPEHCRDQAIPGKPPEGTPDIWKVLDVVPRLANTNAAIGTASLSKLKVLEPTASTGYECRYAMQTMTPFLAINSMRKFYGGSLIAVNDSYTGKSFDPRYDTLGSNLEVVELAGCCMTACECAKLTKGMRCLKSFSLSYETKWHGCGHDWSAGQFVAALMAGVGETLEHLSLSLLNHYGELITGVTDLRGFTVLKELELDTGMLPGPPYTNDMGYDEDLGEEEVSGRTPAVPRLLDMLPMSLERLELLTDNDQTSTECLEALFTDFVAEKTSLPSLAWVMIRRGTSGVTSRTKTVSDVTPLPDALLTACEFAGVNAVDEAKPVRARFMLTFEDRFGVLCE